MRYRTNIHQHLTSSPVDNNTPRPTCILIPSHHQTAIITGDTPQSRRIARRVSLRRPNSREREERSGKQNSHRTASPSRRAPRITPQAAIHTGSSRNNFRISLAQAGDPRVLNRFRFSTVRSGSALSGNTNVARARSNTVRLSPYRSKTMTWVCTEPRNNRNAYQTQPAWIQQG